MIRATIVMLDCSVLEFERKTWKAAAEAVVEASRDGFYHPERWYKIFAVNPSAHPRSPEEWFLSVLVPHLKRGDIPDNDAA
jgi:hypothetical protein